MKKSDQDPTPVDEQQSIEGDHLAAVAGGGIKTEIATAAVKYAVKHPDQVAKAAKWIGGKLH